MHVEMRVVLKGTDASAREFFDRTEMVSLTQRGVQVRTRFVLSPGSEVQVLLPTEKEARSLRVVWCGEGGLQTGLVELEFADPNESWAQETIRVQRESWDF